MEPLTKVYSALQNELKGLSEDHNNLKSKLSANVSNDIESLKTVVLNLLEQKKFQLLADITTSEKLNQDAAKIQACADRLAAEFAKLTSKSNPTPSTESIKAFERQVLGVKAVVEAIRGTQVKGLQCEKVIGEIKASITSLSLGDNKISKDARPTPASDNDNNKWLLTSSRNVSEKEAPYSFSNPVGEGEDMAFWLRPATAIKVEKEWCNATAQWFKFASTMEWLTPRGPAPTSAVISAPAATKPAEPHSDSIVTSWKNFANGVEWYKPRDASVKKSEPPAKKTPEPSAPSSTKTAGDVFSSWAATASSQSWLAASSEKTAAPPTSAPNDCIWLAQKNRETSAPASKDVFSSWSKAAAEVSWVTKKAGTLLPPDMAPLNPLAHWQPNPGPSWVIENKQQVPPTSSKETTPSQTAVNVTNNMDVWLPKGRVPTQTREDKTFSFQTHSSDDSMWLVFTESSPQALPPLSDNMSDWLLPSPISCPNEDDSQDFEIVEDSLIS